MTKTHKVFSNESRGTTLSEVTLIWYSQQGDRDAFASLYDTYHDGIRRYILIRVADPELAEDITSLVFLSTWENLEYLPNRAVPICSLALPHRGQCCR